MRIIIFAFAAFGAPRFRMLRVLFFRKKEPKSSLPGKLTCEVAVAFGGSGIIVVASVAFGAPRLRTSVPPFRAFGQCLPKRTSALHLFGSSRFLSKDLVYVAFA